MAVQQNARRKGYCLDIIRQKDRPGEGIRLRQELHLGGHCQGQSKLLIQLSAGVVEIGEALGFVRSADAVPDCGRSGSIGMASRPRSGKLYGRKINMLRDL